MLTNFSDSQPIFASLHQQAKDSKAGIMSKRSKRAGSGCCSTHII